MSISCRFAAGTEIVISFASCFTSTRPPAKAVLAGQGATTSKGMAGNTPRGLRR